MLCLYRSCYICYVYIGNVIYLMLYMSCLYMLCLYRSWYIGHVI